MILAEINTEKGNFHIVAEDESDARDKANNYFKKKYFTSHNIIKSVEILSCTKNLYSNNTLVL
jgi:acetyl-CoA carboxylase carboxyltransferase component